MLADLTRQIHRAAGRIRRQIHRPQLPDPRLEPVGHRPLRRPLIPRRAITGQRRLHRVPRDPQHPGDLQDRHLPGPAQPPDLSPILHAQHLLPPQLGYEPGSRGSWSKFGCRAVVSIQLPTTKNSSSETRTGRSRSVLTAALASLRNVAAPVPGWFSIRTVNAGRIVYPMPTFWSTVSALASSSAMNTTVPLSPRAVAHKTRLTPAPAIASHSRASSPGWFCRSTVNTLIWCPLSPRQWRRIAAHTERTSPVPRWLARLHIRGRCTDCRT